MSKKLGILGKTAQLARDGSEPRQTIYRPHALDHDYMIQSRKNSPLNKNHKTDVRNETSLVITICSEGINLQVKDRFTYFIYLPETK